MKSGSGGAEQPFQLAPLVQASPAPPVQLKAVAWKDADAAAKETRRVRKRRERMLWGEKSKT